MAKTYTNQKGIKSALANAPDGGHEEHKDTKATGLYFRVYSTGLGSFVHRYKIKGRRRAFSLPVSELKPASTEATISAAITEARAIHAVQRAQVKAGQDPAIERDLQAREIASMPTVEQFADTYIKLYAKAEKKSWQQDKRYLDVEVVPALGALALDKVKRAHIIALLDKKQLAGAMVARNRLISLLSKFFNFAKERGHIDINPASGIKRTTEQSKERALLNNEVTSFWQQTDDNSNFSPSTRLALRLILVTAQRPGEVAQMHESQIQGDVWTIPDTKNGRTHSVPLSPLAMQLIEEAQPHKRNGLLLPNTKGAVMAKTILPKAMTRLDWPELPATPHDLRRTTITEISRLGFNRLTQDKIANHIDKSIGGIYDRHDYMKEKRQALEAWARKLNQIVTGQVESNVVQLHKAS